MCLCVCAAGAGPGPVPASRCECPGVRVCLRRREGTEAPLCAALPLPLSERHLCERSPSGLSIERLECETSIVTPWEPDATDPPPPPPPQCVRRAPAAPRRAAPSRAQPRTAGHSREVRSGAGLRDSRAELPTAGRHGRPAGSGPPARHSLQPPTAVPGAVFTSTAGSRDVRDCHRSRDGRCWACASHRGAPPSEFSRRTGAGTDEAPAAPRRRDRRQRRHFRFASRSIIPPPSPPRSALPPREAKPGLAQGSADAAGWRRGGHVRARDPLPEAVRAVFPRAPGRPSLPPSLPPSGAAALPDPAPPAGEPAGLPARPRFPSGRRRPPAGASPRPHVTALVPPPRPIHAQDAAGPVPRGGARRG
ncbi:uncharacterized protein FYW23_000334 [Sylvia borin]